MNIRKSRSAFIACGSILLTAGILFAQDVPDSESESVDGTHAKGQAEHPGAREVIPHRTNPHKAALLAGSNGVIAPNIAYHGGPLMATPNVYLIWYGNWKQSKGSDTAAGQQIVRDFLFGLSGSKYYKTNTSYGTPSGTFHVAGAYTDNYSQGSQLSDASVQAVVTHAISSGLKKDTNGIYFVLTSSDVSETSGFCSYYCGWHTYGTISGTKNIKYAFVGNANRCLRSCAAQSVGPNGNAGVDGMVSVLAHELEEANTDPDLNAWYDGNGNENADKCAWTFGSNQQRATNGAYYNMKLIGTTGSYRNFLVQRELDKFSKCYVDYVKKIQ